MSKRLKLLLAALWAIAIVTAAVLDAPSDFTSILPVIAVVTLLPGTRRCEWPMRPLRG